MSYAVSAFAGLLAFVMLLVWIGGTVWVLIDARRNSSQSAVLWGLVVFFGAVLGLLLYVLLGRDRVAGATDVDRVPDDRSTQRPSHRCESCGEEYYTDPSAEIATCRSCGGVKVTHLR